MKMFITKTHDFTRITTVILYSRINYFISILKNLFRISFYIWCIFSLRLLWYKLKQTETASSKIGKRRIIYGFVPGAMNLSKWRTWSCPSAQPVPHLPVAEQPFWGLPRRMMLLVNSWFDAGVDKLSIWLIE